MFHSSIPRTGLLLAVLFGVIPASAASLTGQSTEFRPTENLPGRFVICGGGLLPDAIFDRFVKLAGRGRAEIVVIPTASPDVDATDPEQYLSVWKKRSPKSVRLLHTRSRKTADDPAFLKPFETATGVWIGRGDPARLAAVYRGTGVERELKALLRRGGVVGGTSAGAACLTRVMIVGGNPAARTAPGFGLLSGAVVDQHFLIRNRVNRLIRVLEQNPGLVGFGVDDGTALVIGCNRWNRRLIQVIGESKVSVVLSAGKDRPLRLDVLGEGDCADWVALRRAARARVADPFPAPVPPPPEVKNGTLIMVGGGRIPRSVVSRFIEAAGGVEAPLVIVPTAVAGDPTRGRSRFAETLRAAGARNLRVVHARKRAEIEDEEFLAPLRKARGIWFGGGRQWRLVDAYEGTTAVELFHQVLKRGGVIGGSSAGTSIQAGYMVRGDPLGNRDIMAEGYERGFGFLEGTAVDQHFSQRGRHADMRRLMRRYPQLLGIGIDESTAIVVRKHVLEVVGRHKVAVFDSRNLSSRAGLQAPEKDHVELRSGDRYDLTRRIKLSPRKPVR